MSASVCDFTFLECRPDPTEVLDPTVNGHFVNYVLLEEDVVLSVTVAARHRDQFTNGAAR